MVEEMYVEETKEEDVRDITAGFDHSGNSTGVGVISGASGGCDIGGGGFSVASTNPTLEDQKPDYDSLFSVVNGTSNYNREHNNYQFPNDCWSYGAGNGSSNTTTGTGGGFGNGVSLTLGLKQHNDNIQFGPPDPSLFFQRSSDAEQLEPPQIGQQFTTGVVNMDQGGDVGDERQNLQIPYRNMMGGAQLLHDLTR